MMPNDWKVCNNVKKSYAPCHDTPTLLIIIVDSHGENSGFRFDSELGVDLVLDGEAVAVPAEAAGDDVFDCASEDVAVVREAGGEGRAVIEDVFGEILGEF